VLHGVEGDERSSSTETSLAVDSYSSLLLLSLLHETFSNVVWRSGSVNELEIQMLDSIVDKLLAVVGSLVEPNYKSDA